MLTILSWFWAQPKGRAQYRADHVNVWADMVRRNMTMPHRTAVVTDNPQGIDPDIEIIPPPRDLWDARLPNWPETRPQCLRRLVMFRRDAADLFGERFVCMDLDCVVSAPLDPLFDTDVDFKIYRGTAPGRPYNGSMMLIRAGCRPQLYEEFNSADAATAGLRFIGSDQAWISWKLGPGEKTWGPEDGVRFWDRYRRNNIYPKDTRIVFFPGSPKPWQLFRDSFVSRHYRKTKRGRCLILGYAQSVWDEASAALDRFEFNAVIASPEAAEHWPGEILAVANDDDQAERLARMHGYDDIVFCGRSPVEVPA